MVLASNMEKIKPFVETLNDESIHSQFKLLNERIDFPESFVTLLGETSSGKSSLINGLLQQQIIYTASKPTTGTIVELFEYENEKEITPYALLKNARLRRLTEEQFQAECLNPSENVSRIRLNIPAMPYNLTGMRLFDTPGYGSIHEKHEEVLTEFIPNSDLILYLVNYRVGVGEDDAQFLTYISSVLSNDVTFFLVINRVPENVSKDDRRIAEIIGYVQELLNKTIRTFCVPAIKGNVRKLPKAIELWSAIGSEIHSTERLENLNTALSKYQCELLTNIKMEWQKKITGSKLSEKNLESINEELKELKEQQLKAQKIISNTFNKLNEELPKLFFEAKKNIEVQLAQEVKKSNKWNSAEECFGYVNVHLLPKLEQTEREGIVAFIEKEIESLNNELNELMNMAFVNFVQKIEIISNQLRPLIEGITKRVLTHSADVGLKSVLARYGGRGGAGAGVANLGKKVMKKTGEMVGKKFKRDQYNQLAKFLRKIGATSTRNLTIFTTILTEGFFYVIGAHMWQGKLIKEASKGLEKWRSETVEDILKDMRDLRTQNVEDVNKWFDEIIETFEIAENPLDEQKLSIWEEEIKKIEGLLADMERKVVYE